MTHLPKRFLRVKNINKDVVIEDENDLANRNADAVPYFEIGHYHDEGVPTKEALIEAINNLIYQKAN